LFNAMVDEAKRQYLEFFRRPNPLFRAEEEQ
jgi:hypothetical protein